MMTVVTTYLKGLFSSANRFMQVSRQVDVHCPTCKSHAVNNVILQQETAVFEGLTLK